MILVNREGNFLNRKKLTVVSSTYNDDGTIKELQVNVERMDSPSKEGTKLDADILEDKIVKLINYKLYGLDPNNEINIVWNGSDSDFEKIIELKYSGVNLYASVPTNQYFTLSINNTMPTNKYIYLSIVPTNSLLNSTQTVQTVSYINIYSDSSCTNYLTRVEVKISFTPSSSSSSD